jgi:cytochrome c oxidase subunit 1
MNFVKTLINGEQGLFKSDTLTPIQKITLRFVVVGLIYYGFAVIEGMIMRIFQVSQISIIGREQYFAILTAHPLIGIFGSTYSIVFGAFLFLVPFLMDMVVPHAGYFYFLVGRIRISLCTFIYIVLAIAG